jgi:hypothetical protein
VVDRLVRCEDDRAVISTEDYLFFVDHALDGLVDIVTDLGDDLANRRPELPGANSPFVILTHCLGVLEYYAAEAVAGREVNRDRDSEFVATGRVSDLAARARAVREQFAADIATLEPEAAPRRPLRGRQDATRRTQGGALVHVYEELSQHLGQLEITRDLLRAEWCRTA